MITGHKEQLEYLEHASPAPTPAPAPVEQLLAEIPLANVRAKVTAAVAMIRGGTKELGLGGGRSLWGNDRIDDEGAKTTAAVLAGNSLTSLYLSRNQIGAEGAKAIAAVLAGSSLTTLYLHLNGIGAGGAKAIVSVAVSSLTSLCVDGNEIGDEGAEAIAAVLAGSSLTSLHLNHMHNEIGDEGAKAIAAVLVGSSLTVRYTWTRGLTRTRSAPRVLRP
jgi:hypothetical protein